MAKKRMSISMPGIRPEEKCDASPRRSFTPFSEILSRYRENIDKTCREKTLHNYSSRCKILEEYNETRYCPIRYAYEYDSAFVNEFLDYILLDRDAGPRTRNNYKGSIDYRSFACSLKIWRAETKKGCSTFV